MKAIRVHNPGGPETMKLDSIPTPTPKPGQALIRVEAAGVNFIDTYHRSGAYDAPKPIAIGREGAGVIEAVGEGCELAVGTAVAWTGIPGSYATHVVAGSDALVTIPEGLSTRQAAAAMLQGMTAHYLTRSTYPLGENDTCLIHAIAGGVGLLLCQLAKRAGARVLGTTSSEKKAQAALDLGADYVILYTESDFKREVNNTTAGAGVQVVYDSVGKISFEDSLQCLAPRGTLVLFGQSSGKVDPIDPQILNQAGSVYLTRPSLFHYIASTEELRGRAGDVLTWIAAGELTLTIDRELPLSEAAEAHRLLESRKTSGKLLLIPD
jgi:NADPH2:quinone reductase